MSEPQALPSPERGDRLIELRLPSRLGYEKIAMDTATAMARRMGFSIERIEALRTAIGEAVTNAIEHGNEHDSAMRVVVVLTVREDGLVVDVTDQGRRRFEQPATFGKPDIAAVMEQSEKGGWGIWLIREMVDEVLFSVTPGGGNQVSMIIHLER